MPTQSLGQSITVTFSGEFTIAQDVLASPTATLGGNPLRRRDPFLSQQPQALPSAGIPEDGSEKALRDSLKDSADFEEIQSFTLNPTKPSSPLLGQRPATLGDAPAESDSVSLDVTVEEASDAVLLIERDGIYRWVLPQEATGTAVPQPTLGAQSSKQRTRRLTFYVVRDSTHEAPPAGGTPTLGIPPSIVYGAIRAVVFKFAVPPLVNGVVALLDGRIKEGLVPISMGAPLKWKSDQDKVAALINLAQPAVEGGAARRVRRLLLLIHGTFSSTAGSFCGLVATDDGQQLLSKWIAPEDISGKYDIVLGYDHHTLGKTPLENANDLWAALLEIAASLTSNATVDLECSVVAYSRGGLVYHTLVEKVIPQASDTEKAKLPIVWKSVVLVATTNAGTQLASESNWKTFVDVYTTLAVLTCKAIALIPTATVAATAAEEVFKGVGGLVKALASYAVGEGKVPGLAAMTPGSELILSLNESNKVGVDDGAVYYCISSSATGRNPVENAIVHLVKDLMNEENDLVVNTDSVGNFGTSARALQVTKRYTCQGDTFIYHLNYFVQADVVGKISDWLA